MPQLEPLNLKITGSADGLTTALGKAENAVRGMGGSMSGGLGGVSGLLSKLGSMGNLATLALTGIAAAAGTAVAGLMAIKQGMNAIDDTTDAANRLGVTFGELKGLRLSLGEATGLDAASIDQAVAKLQINLGEAATTGTGAAFDALQELGLNAADLLAAGPQRAMEMIAGQISQIDDKSKQLQLSFAILGKSGVAIAAALRESPEGLREAAEWAQKNLSLTEQQVNQVGSANDAWDRMTARIQAIFEMISAEFAPLIEVIADDILGLADDFGSVADIAKIAVDVVAQLYGIMKDIMELGTKPAAAVASIMQGNFGAAWDQLGEAVSFDSAFNSQLGVQAARERARQRKPRDQVSDAELEALEAQNQALDATKQAAAAVEDKAKEIEQAAIKPLPVLGAITDRAAQIKAIAEARNQAAALDKQNQMLEAQKATNTRLDRLIAVTAGRTEPVPIAL